MVCRGENEKETEKMKKLMIAAAIVCAAAFAQAATVNWCTGTIYAAGEGGTGYGDSPLAQSTDLYSIVLTVGTGYDSATDSLTGIVDLTDKFSSTTIQDGGYEDGIAGIGELTGDFFGKMVVTEIATGNTLESEVFGFNVSSVSKKGEPYIGDGGMGITLAKGGELDETYGAWSTSGWQSVPEPTSGLLLLIGVAGLALRRRRA